MVRRSVLLKRIAGVRDHLARVATRRHLPLDQFLCDRDSQDVVLHNLQLAVQGCIDLGSHLIADQGWGVPGSYAEVFDLLRQHDVLSADLSRRMVQAAGFRNILVHDYLEVDLPTAYEIAASRTADLEAFLARVVERFDL